MNFRAVLFLCLQKGAYSCVPRLSTHTFSVLKYLLFFHVCSCYCEDKNNISVDVLAKHCLQEKQTRAHSLLLPACTFLCALNPQHCVTSSIPQKTFSSHILMVAGAAVISKLSHLIRNGWSLRTGETWRLTCEPYSVWCSAKWCRPLTHSHAPLKTL